MVRQNFLGYFYEPTIFDDVKDNFTVMKESLLVNGSNLTFKNFDEVMKEQMIMILVYVVTFTQLILKANEVEI